MDLSHGHWELPSGSGVLREQWKEEGGLNPEAGEAAVWGEVRSADMAQPGWWECEGNKSGKKHLKGFDV